MIRILHIISPGTGSYGGIEAFLYGYFEYIDKTKIGFDYSFCGQNTMRIKMNDELMKNSKFIEFRALCSDNNTINNWIQLIKRVRKQVKIGKYEIVEVHSASPLILACCGMALRKTNCACRIAHSHALAPQIKNPAMRLVELICSKIIRGSYEKFFSCSYAAATVFGKKVVDSKAFYKINNAIDEKKFAYNPTIRSMIREKYTVAESTKVIGHVARLSPEKNQRFLIDVFYEYHKMNPDSVLWLIGDGSCRTEIEERISELGITRNVVMFGEQKNISEFLQAMDFFLVTSYGEGLCISAIESQAAGLKTLVSTGIPDECGITDLFYRISLEEGAKSWAEFMLENMDYDRKKQTNSIRSSGYDLQEAVGILQEIYTEGCRCV